jgi:hypothetical protein
MPRRAFTLLAFLAVVSRLAAAEVPVDISPFAPASAPIASAPAAAATASARWELLGIMGTRAAPTVRIRDTADNAAAWVSVGQTFGVLRVVAADVDANTATIQVGEERAVLNLRPSGVTPGAAPTTTATGSSPGTPPPLPSTGDAAADARRDQAIAEREARMLVSDLLEISVVQRKAYEEKQAAAAKAAAEGTP